MGQTHVVEQGEHISDIAQRYGFGDYNPIWDHPSNAALKKLRTSPNVLLPGDQLFVPDRQAKIENAATGRVHVFQTPMPTVELKLVLRDFDNEPMPGVECELEVEGIVRALKTNGKGLLECTIPRTAKKGTLRARSLGLELPLLIGHLDPPDTETGWKARLANLGYWKPAAHSEKETPERLSYAIQEFQCDFGLKLTGKPDQATLGKLEALHGS